MKTNKKNIWKSLKKYIYNSYLCIRFPFLYTRNRFSGKHYNNYKIQEKYRECEQEYRDIIGVSLLHKDDMVSEKTEHKEVSYIQFMQDEFGNNIIPYLNHRVLSIDVTNPEHGAQTNDIDITPLLEDTGLTPDDIVFVTIRKTVRCYGANHKPKPGYSLCFVYDKDIDKESNNIKHYFHTVKYIKNKWAKQSMIFYKALHNVLELFHFLPRYTELDAMDKGWRKTFGIDICKEIKHSLIYTIIRKENITWKTPFKYIKAYCKGLKLLYTFRITQIKEKFGSLRFYTAWGTDEIYDIISKYERYSYHICINCGKPAKYITTGWICPYCEDCIDPREKESAKLISEVEEEEEKYVQEECLD